MARKRNPKPVTPNPDDWDVRALRKRLSLSQPEFAARLGISWRTVSRWEQGHFAPSAMARKALAELASQKSARRDLSSKSQASKGGL